MVSSSLQVRPRSQPFACDRKAQLAVRGLCEPLQPADCLRGNRWSLAIVFEYYLLNREDSMSSLKPLPQKTIHSRFVRLKKSWDLKATGHFTTT
jgi:hypothetical protein